MPFNEVRPVLIMCRTRLGRGRILLKVLLAWAVFSVAFTFAFQNILSDNEGLLLLALPGIIIGVISSSVQYAVNYMYKEALGIIKESYPSLADKSHEELRRFMEEWSKML